MASKHSKTGPSATLPDFTVPIIIGLLVIRLANAYLLRTYFQPDEYFQALEPAWQLAFGPESGAWITWEWREQLRSAIHPVLFASCYKIASSIATTLSLSSDTRTELVLAAPRLLQVPIAAAIDFHTWRLAQVIFGVNSHESVAALLLSVWSPWQWYSSTRTFSNTLETLLTVVALTWWPWQQTVLPKQAKPHDPKLHIERQEIDLKEILKQGGQSEDFSEVKAKPIVTQEEPKQKTASSASSPLLFNQSHLAFVAAALACVIRPTNAIIWIAIIVTAVQRYGGWEKATELLSSTTLAMLTVPVISVAIDRAFYGTWTVPQFNFLYFNIVEAVGTFYGRNRIDYYFTEGIPILLTTALPFGVAGFWQALRPGPDRGGLQGYDERQTRFLLAVAVAVTVLAFTCIAHKEVRFIYPLLPILHVLAARPIANYFTIFPVDENRFKVGLLILGLTINLYIMTYTALIHQRGVIDVMSFLRHEAESHTGNMTVGFLMPCHSTPWRSHLIHPSINAWALTCEPPLGVPLAWRSEYEDEADIFYNHPGGWIDRNLVDRNSILYSKPLMRPTPEERQRPWPDYLVFFEHLEPTMNGILDGTRYSEHTRFFNTHWHDDWRRRGDVVVHKLDSATS